MAKKSRRRKQYRGEDSSLPPQIIRVEAPERNRYQAWWHEHKRAVTVRAIQFALVTLVVSIIFWIF